MSCKTSLLLMAAAALGVASAAQASPIGSPAIDSNLIQFTFDGPTITSIQPNGIYEVTSGKAYSFPPSVTSTGSGDYTVWDITFDADRTASSPVAYDFIQYTGGFPPPYHQWSPVAALVPGYPQELNFFFGVNICAASPNIGCFTLYLGQGNDGFPLFQNNWWIGSPSLAVAFDGSYADLEFGEGVDLHFTPDGNGVYTFFIDQFGGSPRPVPEPASGAILMAGVAAALVVRRRRRGRTDRTRLLTF